MPAPHSCSCCSRSQAHSGANVSSLTLAFSSEGPRSGLANRQGSDRRDIVKNPSYSTSVPRSRHGSHQRQEDKDDSERGHVPYQGSQEENSGYVQGEIGDAAPKIKLNAPLRHPTVPRRDMRDQHACSKQGERLDEILQRSRQAARHSI